MTSQGTSLAPSRVGHPRRQDWPEALCAYILAAMPKPHAWGTNDCVTFARGAVEAMTGHPVALPVTWYDEPSAMAAIAAMGGFEAAIDSVLPRLPLPLCAGRGDLVLVTVPGRAPWLAVCHDGRAFAPANNGLSSVPIARAVTAWAVARDVTPGDVSGVIGG